MVIELKDKCPSRGAHPDLLLAEELVYKPSGLILQNLKTENESADYGAAEFTINNHSIKFRVGKDYSDKSWTICPFLETYR